MFSCDQRHWLANLKRALCEANNFSASVYVPVVVEAEFVGATVVELCLGVEEWAA